MRRVVLELRALVVLADVLHGQGVEAELVLEAGQVVLGRLDDVDPEQMRVVHQLGDGVAVELADLPLFVVPDCDHT